MAGERINILKFMGVVCLGLASCRSSRIDNRISFKRSEKKMKVSEISFADLPNWQDEDASKALSAFKKSCTKIMNEGDFVASSQIVISASFMKEACSAIPEEPITQSLAKTYFEYWFAPYKVSTMDGNSTGTITGYYETELEGDIAPSCENLTPIYGKPYDLPSNGGKYLSRREIANGKLRDRAPVLFWAKNPSDVILLHIQGSGVVKTPNGKYYRVGYAGNNGYSFTGIGSILIKHNIKPAGGYSMNAVKDWLDSHPEQTAKLILENERFIFFRDIVGDGPIGAMGVPLTPERSIAVDPEYIPLGLPLYLHTKDADGETISKTVVAQDIGTAIKGVIRADLFWGSGARAFSKAGRQHSQGTYYIFLPKDGKNFAVKK